MSYNNLVRTLRELKEQSIRIVGTDTEAKIDLFHFNQTSALAWILGAESSGMRCLTRKYCDVFVNISNRLPVVFVWLKLRASVY